MLPRSATIGSIFGLVATVAISGCGGSAADPLGATTNASTQSTLRSLMTPPIPPELQGPAQRGRARPHLVFNRGAKVAMWASDTNFNYLLGQDATGRKTVTAVDLSQNNCYSPVALKVDRARNVWVGCELTSLSATNGALQEYGSDGMFLQRFTPACPAHVSGCESFSGYGYDGGIDPRGNVFASLNLYDIQICNPSCNDALSAGFEWWPKGSPSAAPRLISVGTNCSPICGVGFMDVDSSGNLWFTFSGYDQSTYGFGLGEISNPTKSPKLTIIEPIGSYGFFGGVYASSGGKTLNVIDQKARTISQYHLPLAVSGAPFNVLGPTLLNAFGIGDPVSGGFNAAGTKMAIGDAGGWFDVGKVTPNAWSTVASPNFYSGIEGAAYTPSDK